MVVVQGGGTFWVTFTPAGDAEDSFNPDKTYEEVVAAINAGQIVMAKVVEAEESFILLCGGYTENEVMSMALFGNAVALGEQIANIYGIAVLKGQTPGGDLHSTLTIKSL